MMVPMPSDQSSEATLQTTPDAVGSQTVGPYYAIGLDYLVSEVAAGPEAAGTHVTLAGTLFDADGVPVPDAIVEIWQADAEGRFSNNVPLPAELAAAEVAGFARLSTHNDGRFLLRTVKPGPVVFPDGRIQAPHLVVLVLMRGILRHLVTRVYFPGDLANETDPVLALVPKARRGTLFARNSSGGNFQWDIHLQGPLETVFFEA